MSDPFIGQVNLAAFPFAPYGWATCDGSILQIRQNTALFSVLGAMFGGDAAQTFALPDLMGRAAVGANGAFRTATTLPMASKGGVESVVLTPAQAPPHTHGVNCLPATATPAGTGNDPAAGIPSICQEYLPPASAGALVPLNPASIEAAGGGLAHTNMQPGLAINFIIALMGVFPTRP